MIRFIVGTLTGLVLMAPHAWGDNEVSHGRMVDEICSRPRHFYRMHGISIMPEACDE